MKWIVGLALLAACGTSNPGTVNSSSLAAKSSPVTTLHRNPSSTSSSSSTAGTTLESADSVLADSRLVGTWRLNSVSGPTSKPLQPNKQSGYAIFQIFEGKIALSLTHGKDGCAETGGVLSESRNQVKLVSIFDKAAIECFTNVPAIKKLGMTFLVGDRVTISEKDLLIVSEKSHLEFRFVRE
jgi:hypothetical protein